MEGKIQQQVTSHGPGRTPLSGPAFLWSGLCFLRLWTTFALPSRAPCPWALLRLMQPLSRLQASVLLPSWLHPLTLALRERRAVCQAMGDPSGLPHEAVWPGCRVGWKQGWFPQSSPFLRSPATLCPLASTPGLRALWLELKLDPTSHVGSQGQLRARPEHSWWPLPGGLGGL